MKNFLSKITKDGALITAMCACIILITTAALITMYNRNRQSSVDGIMSEKQTEEETAKAEINEALVETEETAEATEKETKNITLRIETEAELAKVTEEETEATESTENMDTAANDADSEAANANAQAETEAQTEVTETPESVVNEANAMPAEEVSETVAETQANVDTSGLSMNFTEESKLVWPVSGEVIREFSMDTTVWFSTLKQYRTSDAIQIQSAAGTEVVAAATGRVTAVGENDQLGNFVVMDLGNGYAATYAQLTDIIVEPGNYVTAGTSFACVAEPTYYYVVDGAHLYFKLTHDDELLDPLDYLE